MCGINCHAGSFDCAQRLVTMTFDSPIIWLFDSQQQASCYGNKERCITNSILVSIVLWPFGTKSVLSLEFFCCNQVIPLKYILETLKRKNRETHPMLPHPE